MRLKYVRRLMKTAVMMVMCVVLYLCSSCRRTTFNFPSFSLVTGIQSPTARHHRERQRERKREREEEEDEVESRERAREDGRKKKRGRSVSLHTTFTWKERRKFESI